MRVRPNTYAQRWQNRLQQTLFEPLVDTKVEGAVS